VHHIPSLKRQTRTPIDAKSLEASTSPQVQESPVINFRDEMIKRRAVESSDVSRGVAHESHQFAREPECFAWIATRRTEIVEPLLALYRRSMDCEECRIQMY